MKENDSSQDEDSCNKNYPLASTRVLLVQANNYRTNLVNGLDLSMSLSASGSLKLFQGETVLYTADLNLLEACEIMLQQNITAVSEPVYEL